MRCCALEIKINKVHFLMNVGQLNRFTDISEHGFFLRKQGLVSLLRLAYRCLYDLIRPRIFNNLHGVIRPNHM